MRQGGSPLVLPKNLTLHRIIECQKLEGTHKDHEVQLHTATTQENILFVALLVEANYLLGSCLALSPWKTNIVIDFPCQYQYFLFSCQQ